MRLIHFFESSSILQGSESLADESPGIHWRFQKLISWLCECIREDPECISLGCKMLIVWEPIGSVRLCLAQDLKAEILLRFPQMEIKLKKLSDFLHQVWIVNQPYAILKDHKLMDKAREKGVRYLIGIF